MSRRSEKYDVNSLRSFGEFAAGVSMYLLLDHDLRFNEIDVEFALGLIFKGWDSSDVDEEARAVAARIAMMNRSAEDIVKDLEEREKRESDAELEAWNAPEEEDTEEEQRAKDEADPEES